MHPPFLSALLLLSLALAPLRAQPTPVGRWQAMSDVDGKPSALIEIREVDGQFVGTIRALFSASDSAAVCDQCEGERRDQRVLGMQILSGMRADGDGWGGGSILDPESGKVYHAKMHLEDGGKRLVVRGYIGFAIFGRSQVWMRVE
jgi:uncharacterized protein (DUF2147 family)